MTANPTTAEQLHEWLAWTGVRFAGVPEASIVERIEAEAVAAYLASPAFREALAAAKVKAGGEDSPVNDRDLEFSDAIIRELTNGGD